MYIKKPILKIIYSDYFLKAYSVGIITKSIISIILEVKIYFASGDLNV